MSDEEPTGSCIVCSARDPLPELAPACGVCRSRARNQLQEIPELVDVLAGGGYVMRDGRTAQPEVRYPPGHRLAGILVPHFDQPANVLPSGPINGQSSAPRVAGSREAPVPISVDRTDLLSAARVLHLTKAYEEQREDQVGYLPAATVLDGWCRDWSELRRESVPQPHVGVQCGWLLDRLDWAFTDHPAVDEMVHEVGDLWHVLRRAAGLVTPKRELVVGVPCRSVECDLKTLWRVPGSDFVECGTCGALLTEDELQEWVRMLRAPLCARRKAEWWCARTKKHAGPCAPAGLEEAFMQKIPTVFVRDFAEPSNGRWVTREVNPDCKWVLAGEGVPTRKYDGTCVMFDGRDWWARREVKPGKATPPNFVLVATDDTTGKTVGWEPIAQSAFAKYHAEAVAAFNDWPVGTYELVGPKVNGNPERAEGHELWAHAAAVVLGDRGRTFDDIRRQVLDAAGSGVEGIVYHHMDGRMAKIKARDFQPESA